MQKKKLQNLWYSRVNFRPTPRRVTVEGEELEPLDYEWIITSVSEDGVVSATNPSTGHVAILHPDRIHHFDHEPHREWDGQKHGLLELRVQLVLSGNLIHYLPLKNFRPRERRRVRISRRIR